MKIQGSKYEYYIDSRVLTQGVRISENLFINHFNIIFLSVCESFQTTYIPNLLG